MRKQFGLTSVAVAVLMLVMGPANAASITLGGDNGLLGLGGSGNDDVTVDLGGSSDGGLLDLGGSSGSDADVDVDLGGTNANGIIDLGGDDGVNVDLFGRPGTTGPNSTANVNLGDDSENDVFLDLFGTGGGGSNTAAVNLGGTGNNGAAIDLFGDGDGDGDTDPTTTGAITPPGGSGGNGGTGRNGGAGGSGGTQIFAPGASAPGIRPAVRPATDRLAVTGSTKCFSPDAVQIDNLLSRNSYSGSVAASWKSANNIKLVPINLCDDAKVRLAAAMTTDANIRVLHSAVAADATITAALRPGYEARNVLAVDKSGTDLTVYVY